MKNHLRTLMFLFSISLFTFSDLQAEMKNKSLIGEWLYTVSDAPYGYEKGSLIFSEKSGQTICVIKVEAGELVASNLKIVKKNITFTTEVEGNSINIALTHKKNKLTGNVQTPEGPKTLTAIKK